MRAGDYPEKIAADHGMKVSELWALNPGLRGRTIHPGEVLKVVDDQITAPTYTRHLAEALLDLLELEHGGVVHVSAEGECSWYEFAREIAALAAPGTPVEPITSEELERAAPRPPYTVLNKHRFLIWTGRRMPEWRVGLREYLEEEGWLA